MSKSQTYNEPPNLLGMEYYYFQSYRRWSFTRFIDFLRSCQLASHQPLFICVLIKVKKRSLVWRLNATLAFRYCFAGHWASGKSKKDATRYAKKRKRKGRERKKTAHIFYCSLFKLFTITCESVLREASLPLFRTIFSICRCVYIRVQGIKWILVSLK